MEIVIGKSAGFCFGVKRTIELVMKELEHNSPIYCLGEIIHNEAIVKNLEKLGLIQIENLDEIREGTLVIRAHGVSPDVYEKAKRRHLKVIDLTCPKVKYVQNLARTYKEKGYYIIIAGEENHPEVIGIKGWAGENSVVVGNLDEIKKISPTKNQMVLLSQTTFSFKILNDMKKQLKNAKIINTICPATEERQKEVKKIAEKVDVMIIIGGKKSSNSRRLFDIAKTYCQKTLFIQNKNELNRKMFKNVNKIGIMTGVSTSPETIEEIVFYIPKNNI